AASGRREGRGGRAGEGDVASRRAPRARLDAIVTACEAGDGPAAVRMINALLAETGAIPQVVAHDGRGPHIHVSRAAAPMADRIAAHLAMGLAELLVAGESGRLRTCASPTCREAFLDESRTRSRRRPPSGPVVPAPAARAETGCTSPRPGPVGRGPGSGASPAAPGAGAPGLFKEPRPPRNPPRTLPRLNLG